MDLQGEDLGFLYEYSHVHEEFLRDSSSWLDANAMEEFLSLFLRNIKSQEHEHELFQKIGHNAPDLRSWGVLDSVLKMMQRPQEILAQPERFLSYFISPEPPIENLIRVQDRVEFDLPISTDQYPLVTSYLKAAFESLPAYVGQPLASCDWNGIHFKIDWSQQQPSIFDQEEVGHQISPDLMNSIQSELQRLQKELAEKNSELTKKNNEVAQAQKDLQSHLRREIETERVLEPSLFSQADLQIVIPQETTQILLNNVARLHDYMVRSQQLMTMLVAQDRMNPQVREAMRRVDWEYVKEQFPKIVQETSSILMNIKKTNHELNNIENPDQNQVQKQE